MNILEHHRFPGGGAKPLSRLCAPESLTSLENPALVVAHPGHELRVFGWMSEYKPRVYVITDGSGRHGISRLSSTEALVNRLAACPGEIFGHVSDAQIYRAVLDQDSSMFLDLADALAAAFIKNNIDFVAADAQEGYNPSHDLCRVLVNAAVRMAERSTGKHIANYEFCLTEWEQECQANHDAQCFHVRLDDQLLSRKLTAAEEYVELKDEVRSGIAQRGREYFRVECLREASSSALCDQLWVKPFYEVWGERRVGGGEYQSVIRFREHILPLTDAILDHAAQANLNHLAGQVS